VCLAAEGFGGLQGKKIPGYEVEIKASWEGEIREGGQADGAVIAKANGTVRC
jgi:hypothetical protein